MSAAHLQALPEDPHKALAGVLAVGVHGVLAVLLFFGVSWRNPPPAVVAVELVSAQAVSERPAPPRPARPPKTPPPKAVPVPLPKPDIAIKDKTRPPPPPAPKLPNPPPDAAQRLLKDREAESLAREFQQIENKKRNQQLERELARSQADAAAARAAAQAEREQAARLKAEAAATGARAAAIAGYQDRIRGKIRGNIVRPVELRGNPMVRFDVIQLPSGEILEVVLVAGSGNRAWDEAVERAIHKSSPLPKADLSELYQRVLHLTFCPDEERACR